MRFSFSHIMSLLLIMGFLVLVLSCPLTKTLTTPEGYQSMIGVALAAPCVIIFIILVKIFHK